MSQNPEQQRQGAHDDRERATEDHGRAETDSATAAADSLAAAAQQGDTAAALLLVARSIDNWAHEVRDLGKTMRGRTEHFKRLLWGLLVVVVLTGVLSFGTRSIATRIDAVTDPGGEYARQAGLRTNERLLGLTEENDCRHRRSLAGLPAPDPGPDRQRPKPCAGQTPADVYPGVGTP